MTGIFWRKWVLTLVIFFLSHMLGAWGFFAHKLITQMSVFTLPSEMIGYYKKNLEILKEASVQPDIRRYVISGEGPKHYIDIDVYGDSAVYTFPEKWKDAISLVGEDSLIQHGIVPWSIQWTERDLTEAFKLKDVAKIIRYSADLAHYIADAHVPLHSTVNYNGQFTGQRGIHRLWETRVPEVRSGEYSFLVGKAVYINNTRETIWEIIRQSHQLVDSVLIIERSCSENFPEDRKYAYIVRGKTEKLDYSDAYVKYFAEEMNEMVEKRMQSAVKMIGSFWYTCWINAGQPDLNDLSVWPNKSISAPKDTMKVKAKRDHLHQN